MIFGAGGGGGGWFLQICETILRRFENFDDYLQKIKRKAIVKLFALHADAKII